MHDAFSLAEALVNGLEEREAHLVGECADGLASWDKYQRRVGRIAEVRELKQVIKDLLHEENNDG